MLCLFVNTIAVPGNLLCWAFYKFWINNSWKEFITPKNVLSRRADQLPNIIENHNYTGSSDLVIGKWNHNFIIFIQNTVKYRFYVPASQLASPLHFSILYPSNYYFITFGSLKTEIIHGDVKSCEVADLCYISDWIDHSKVSGHPPLVRCMWWYLHKERGWYYD